MFETQTSLCAGTQQKVGEQIDQSLFKDEKESSEIIPHVTSSYNLLRDHKLEEATREVVRVLESVWKHFSVQKYASMFLEYAKVQQALYGFEQSNGGGRYRDHVIHVFNVFVSGLVLFSKMIQSDPEATFKLLRIRGERDKVPLPFPHKYDERKRLYYLWSLMSTLHDIALPIQRKEDVIEGLNKFYGYFNLQTDDLQLPFPQMSTLKMAEYLQLMGRMFEEGIVLNGNEGDPNYRLASEQDSSPYFWTTMLDAFEKRRHGVLAAFFLYETIAETFLMKRNPELLYDPDVVAVMSSERLDLPVERAKWKRILEEKLGTAEWNDVEKFSRIYEGRAQSKLYKRFVFEQDITRAALAVSIHDLDTRRAPKLLPIKFSRLPLTWLLILLDESQEYYRPEEFYLVELVRFQDFPRLDAAWTSNGQERRLTLTMEFDLKNPREEDLKLILRKYNDWGKKHNRSPVASFAELVESTWNEMWRTILAKLSFDSTEPVSLRIGVNIEETNLRQFASPNWVNPKEK